MRTIYKYPCPIDDDFTLTLPQGSSILQVGGQRGAVSIWAVVDTNAPATPVQFHIAGTGHPLPDNIADYDHVGTCIADPFVWHVFVKKDAGVKVGWGGLP